MTETIDKINGGKIHIDMLCRVKWLLDELLANGLMMTADDALQASLSCNNGTWLCKLSCRQSKWNVCGTSSTREDAVHGAWWLACGSLGL